MPLIRSISGLRATLGDSLTPEIISKYTAAFCRILPQGEIVIGRDGRPSGKWIEKIVKGTIIACGRKVRVLTVAPTPTVQLETEFSDAAGGISITASHNPEMWNGLKFIGSDGVFLDADQNALLWKALDGENFEFQTSPAFFEPVYDSGAVKRHCEKILNIPSIAVSIAAIREMNLKVVVDAVNASASWAMPLMLKLMGCSVIDLYCNFSGVFPHTPEPLPENLTELAKAVVEHNADLGVAVDPDGDRLVLIDGNGNPIGEEKTITIAADAALALSDSENKAVVVNHSTTMLVDHVAKQNNAKIFRSPVGEINVVKKMKETGALIGGEGSGGVIFPECHYGRDSLAGIALILAHIQRTGQSLAEIAASYPETVMKKSKFAFSGSFSDNLPKLTVGFNDAEIIVDDGFKAVYSEGWVQARASNTEPIVRVIAESYTESETDKLIAKVMEIIG